MGDVEGVTIGEAEGDVVTEIFDAPEFPVSELIEISGCVLGEADGVGDCEVSIGAVEASSFESFCPLGVSAFRPNAIEIAASAPPPTTVLLIVLPDSCLRFNRRRRLASLRACSVI